MLLEACGHCTQPGWLLERPQRVGGSGSGLVGVHHDAQGHVTPLETPPPPPGVMYIGYYMDALGYFQEMAKYIFKQDISLSRG